MWNSHYTIIHSYLAVNINARKRLILCVLRSANYNKTLTRKNIFRFDCKVNKMAFDKREF